MERNTELYRYMSFKRFYQMLFQKRIAFVLPEKWDDEYERFWQKSLSSEEGKKRCKEYIKHYKGDPHKIKTQIESLSEANFKNTYSLCFSRCRDEELLWRAYSDDKKGIMITTSCGRIEDLFDSPPHIEEIKYDLNPADMFDWFMKHFMVLSDGSVVNWDICEFLKHKRSCFSYEKEVRVMYHHFEPTEEGIIYRDIPSLSDFICEVLVHPLADDEYVEVIKLLCEHFNICCAGRSTIYIFQSL